MLKNIQTIMLMKQMVLITDGAAADQADGSLIHAVEADAGKDDSKNKSFNGTNTDSIDSDQDPQRGRQTGGQPGQGEG